LPASVCLQPCVCSWPHWPGTCQAFKLLPPRPAPTLKGKWSVGEALVSLPHHHYHLQVIVCTKLLVPVMFEGGGGSSQYHYVMGAHISWTMDGGRRPGWRPYVCRPSCASRANLVTSVSRLFPPHAVGGWGVRGAECEPECLSGLMLVPSVGTCQYWRANDHGFQVGNALSLRTTLTRHPCMALHA